MTDTWGHWCYEQESVRLPVSTPRCPQCGALNLEGAKVKTITNARLAHISIDDDGLGTIEKVENMKELSRTMYDLKEALWENRERVLLENDMGAKYEIYMAKVIGAATDDPGLILKIAPVR